MSVALYVSLSVELYVSLSIVLYVSLSNILFVSFSIVVEFSISVVFNIGIEIGIVAGISVGVVSEDEGGLKIEGNISFNAGYTTAAIVINAANRSPNKNAFIFIAKLIYFYLLIANIIYLRELKIKNAKN